MTADRPGRKIVVSLDFAFAIEYCMWEATLHVFRVTTYKQDFRRILLPRQAGKHFMWHPSKYASMSTVQSIGFK